ncbi:MAG: 6-phosphogluconolactonase [Proteobacteria bacterium]|nr:6-phosphogluconolactonase [Pseudomonadota bacterium]
MVNVKIFKDSTALFEQAAEDFLMEIKKKITNKNKLKVALSGGKTPQFFFDMLSEDRFKNDIPWEKIQFFFVDERYVKLNDPESNYHMAQVHLFAKIPAPKENIFPVNTELADPQLSAADYRQQLLHVFHINEQQLPSFDLCYLGAGNDGHTASLMPFTDAVNYYADNPAIENDPMVIALWAPKQNMYRISLSPPVINQSKKIYFQVTGAEKAEAVKAILQGQYDPVRYPAQLIKSIQGQVIWYLDQAAASALVGKK